MRSHMRNYDSLLEKVVYTADNVELGVVDDVFVDKKSGDASWVAVSTSDGLQYVPLRDADLTRDGVVLSYDFQTINAAPDVDITKGPSYDDTHTLISYYEDPSSKYQQHTISKGDTMDVEDEHPIETSDSAEKHENHVVLNETNSSAGDREHIAVDLHREEVGVEKRTVPAGRVRLKKYIVENTVQVPVTLREERARLVVDTINEPHTEDVDLDRLVTEDLQEVVLNREVAVINKHVIQVSKARIEKYDEEHDTHIPTTVREERAELEEVR